MKYLFVLEIVLLCVGFYSCKKNTVSPQTLNLLQKKWLMVQDSIHYPSLPSADYKYFGTANDYYEFFPDDSVHEQFGTPGLPRYFNFTAAYFLSNNSTISLKLDPHGYYTIVMLTENALVLSNQVYASYVRGNTYYGIRITNFKR